MSRRRWVQIDGELLEVSADYEQPSRDVAAANGLLWNDREYQDMNDPRFASRSQHRAYMKRHGLSTVDDYTQTWMKAEKTRNERMAGIDPGRKAAVIEAYQRVKSGYKPNLQRNEE